MLLKEYLLYWLETYKLPNLSENSANNLQHRIQVHILNREISNRQLEDLKTIDYQLELNELKRSGNRCKLKNQDYFYGRPLAASTVTKIRQIYISLLRYAVADDIIPKNYAELTTPFISRRKRAFPFTDTQKKVFLNYTRSHRFWLLYMLCFVTGCRRAELLGLPWDNVDLEKGEIHIKQSLICIEGIPRISGFTKNYSSMRTIPIPKRIITLLCDWRQKQLAESLTPGYCNSNNLVFTQANGQWIIPNYFSRNFKNVLKRLRFPKTLHVHSIRHTWATNLIQNKVPITDIQVLGGWSRPDTLLNVYSHAIHETQVEAIHNLSDEIFSLLE